MQKVIFDSMIIQELPRLQDIDQHLARIAERYEVCLSAPTFMEFISSLHDSGDRYLPSHQQRLRIVTAPGQGLPLMPPVQYAAKHITGVGPNELGVNPAQIAKWCVTIRDAKSWNDIFAEHPDLSAIAEEVRKYREEQERYIENATDELAGAVEWAARLVHSACGVILNRGQAERLAEALPAAYAHVCDRKRHFAKSNTNAEKEKGAPFDQFQLWYLADEAIHFVTKDRAVLRCALQTVQGSRVHTLNDFLRSCEN